MANLKIGRIVMGMCQTNCYFVYPEGKSEITGVEYQPWHYRYVGLSAAEQIHELSITLEEYVDMFYA